MIKIDPEYFEILKEFGAERTVRCYQCGTCTGICPVSTTDESFPRKAVLLARFGVGDVIENFDTAWLCLSCNLCTEFCPRDVKPSETMLAIKKVLVESGKTPPYIRDFFQNITKQKNPWGMGKFKREDWMKKVDVDVPKVKDNAEFEWLWFVGCAHSFENRNIEVTTKMARIINDIGLNFAILGREEGCCGNDARRAGEEGLFELLAEENTKTFEKYGVERLFTHSPHCYNAFKNWYEGYEVKMLLEILRDAIKSGKLELKNKLDLKVTYHDSCYLGRYNGIYDLPREVLKLIPGVELVEMKNNRRMSLCCGGGAGNIVGDYPGEIQPARVRAQEAAETGADVLAVACPFCLLMLEDGVKTEKLDKQLVVKDIVELVYESAYGED